MIEIAGLERKGRPNAYNSLHPLKAKRREQIRISRTRESAPEEHEKTVFGPSPTSHYFPAHYFDYITGTGTGGYECSLPRNHDHIGLSALQGYCYNARSTRDDCG